MKKGYTPSDNLPPVITMEECYNDEFEEVMGLYTKKYDELPAENEDVEFKIVEFFKKENYEFVPNTYNAEVSLLTMIEQPEFAYQEMPCKLSSEQMFEIIRIYVKENINVDAATITSDYSFHFEVKKKIGLAEPYNKLYNTNTSTRRNAKPKWVTRTISEKQETILNIKDKVSSTSYGENCHVAPAIVGENYADLNEKVTKYLDGLMEEINKKYCECPHCKGWGIIEEKI